MANPVWPVSLPQSAFIGNFKESVENAVVEFPVEAGPPKRRRRISSAQRIVDHTLVLTTTQRATLLTFYETTLGGGVSYFDWIHPIDGGSAVAWQFMEPPSFDILSGNKFQASIKIRKVP